MLAQHFRHLLRNKEGAIPVIFALALFPMLALVGTAIDFAGANGARAKLQAAADAAVLEALSQSNRLESSNGTSNDFLRTDTGYEPVKLGSDLFKVQAENVARATAIQFTLSVERKNGTLTGKLKFSAGYLNMMPNIVKVSTLALSGEAESSMAYASSGFLDIHMLLDTSTSMGIGADASDVDKLMKLNGCGMSCHGAKVPNVTLRIEVLQDAVKSMIDAAEKSFKAMPNGSVPRVRIALNKFDNDPVSVRPLSSSYSALIADVPKVQLAPASAATFGRGTDLKRAIDWLEPTLANSGDGTSALSPRRFVFIVTDGLQDRLPGEEKVWRPLNFPGPYGQQKRTGPVDPAACDALKKKGITVAILYTTYVPITKPFEDVWWKAPLPAIQPNLKACASPNFFFEAGDKSQLLSQFNKMFKSAMLSSSIRLSK